MSPSNLTDQAPARILLALLLCVLVAACGERAAAPAEETMGETLELISLLADSDAGTRTRAFEELRRHLVSETAHADFPDRLTQFHKHAPHACKADHEAQTLHILALFRAQQDVSSILVKQCLRSEHAQVRASALGLARFSDNRIDEVLLAFEPDQITLVAYQEALRQLGTPEAAARLAELAD